MRYIDAIGGMSKIKGGFAAMFCWEYLLMIISNISMVKAYKNLLKIAGIIHIWKAFASESNEYEYGYGIIRIIALSHKLIMITSMTEWNAAMYQVVLYKKYKNIKFPKHRKKKLIIGCPNLKMAKIAI